MILPVTFKGFRPHIVHGNELIVSKGNSVGIIDLEDSFDKVQLVGTYKGSLIEQLGAKFDLSKRALRIGFHDMVSFNGGLVGVQNKSIVWKAAESNKFIQVFSEFRGSRPLKLFKHPVDNTLYFGEYFGNPERSEVYIYKSDNAIDWEVAWTFPAGSIRHVHGIHWDSYRNGIWVLTGDSDKESGLWFSDDNFNTLELITSGTQRARAVEIIPIKEGLLVPMDSPLQENFINLFSLDSKSYTAVCSLPGSAFHAIYTNRLYLVSTVTEPSEVNKVDYASVWASLDGVKWKEITRFDRDWIPVKYQFIGRYAEVFFPSGEYTSNYIFAYAHAVKNASNCMLVWDKKEIVEYLKQ